MIVQERRRKPRRYRETAEQPWTRAAANRGVSSPPSPKILLSAYCGYLVGTTSRGDEGNDVSRWNFASESIARNYEISPSTMTYFISPVNFF
ncbi:PREDICTED: uncharacterized protein LOC105142938 isoform X2 [Acromyrmex echinatior]|uniref:uncharacterized protein LOC105142938 isoform X2 n=1 Tax=Acromyrmex echinatior TaxID=103372 RepID=UPI000580FA2E|nr:PREDICTED: uncharacterized protein LOC105142938 isoform X2 [Acromyrmex echinatior]